MAIEIFYKTVSKWKENSFIVKYNGEAWIIDPGDEFLLLDKEFNIENFKINGIVNTHGHFDHVGAVEAFKNKYSISFFIHEKDKQILRQANLYKKLAGSTDFFTIPRVEKYIVNDDVFVLNDKNIKAHHTPGHTNGSVSFEIDNCLIIGDLFYKDTLGRVDLPGGNIDLLKKSVAFVMDHFEGFIIYPGHGAPFILNNEVINTLKKLI